MYVYMNMHIIYTCIIIHMYVCHYIYIYSRVDVHAHAYTYMYIHTRIYIYIYIDTYVNIQ